MSEQTKPFDGTAVHFTNALNNRPDEFTLYNASSEGNGLIIRHVSTGLHVVLTQDVELAAFCFERANMLSLVSEDIAAEFHDAACSWLGAEFVNALAKNEEVPVHDPAQNQPDPATALRAAHQQAQLAAQKNLWTITNTTTTTDHTADSLHRLTNGLSPTSTSSLG